MNRRIRPLLVATVALAAVLLSRPALAGPPLLCFPFDIGSARSLPMGHGGWQATDPGYDVSKLVPDTLALLNGQTSVMVRMETIRRATIYAATRPSLANALLLELKKRTDAKAPLAAFDYGYLVEAFREWASVLKQPIATEIK
jgi:hypothetical protein